MKRIIVSNGKSFIKKQKPGELERSIPTAVMIAGTLLSPFGWFVVGNAFLGWYGIVLFILGIAFEIHSQQSK